MVSHHSPFLYLPISTLSFRAVLDKQERGLYTVFMQSKGKENNISVLFSWDLSNIEWEMGRVSKIFKFSSSVVLVIITTNGFFLVFFSSLFYNLICNYIISPLLISLPSCPFLVWLPTLKFRISFSWTVVVICTYKKLIETCVSASWVCVLSYLTSLFIYLFLLCYLNPTTKPIVVPSPKHVSKISSAHHFAIITLIQVLLYLSLTTTVNSQIVFLFPTLHIIYTFGGSFYI